MAFPVVMYGCESWTVKKTERRRIDAFELWCWRRLLRVPWAEISHHISSCDDKSCIEQDVVNLDSILKTRDITLPTKVRLVKAMVFPVVMYGCEIWTIKKAEH